MSLDLLDTPLRATWSLGSAGAATSRDEVQIIAGRLVDAGVFYLLLQPPSLENSNCADALQILAAGGCQLQAICTGNEAELALLQQQPPITTLWLDVAAFLGDEIDVVRLETVLSKLRQRSFNPGFLLVPERRHLLKIPQLLSLCEKLAVERFKLPNIGIDANFQASVEGGLPRAEDIAALKALLENGPRLPEHLKLEVHDLFLWELLAPDSAQGREEYGGCQAANSLVHVTPQGDVTPCISWPETLGSLLTDDLIDIWDSPQRLQVRAEIASVPSGCAGCLILNDCYGGCRGLSRIFNQELGQRDLLCSGKR